MPAYNHEKFITQAVQSALSQQTHFHVEIIIGEDCSTDHTREVVIVLQNTYPDKIRLLLHEQNQGLLGKNNTVQIFNACRGKYIAFLEGDDYWTHPQKLQRQVDFLEANPDYVASSHDVRFVYEDNSQPEHTYALPNPKTRISLTDLFWANWSPSMSTVFRRSLFSTFPAWFYEVRMTDWPLAILNSQFGDLQFIPEVMAVYRVHRGGIWSPLAASETELQHLALLERVNTHFNGQYDSLIQKIVPFRHYNLTKIYARAKKPTQARFHAVQCFRAWRTKKFALQNALKAMAFAWLTV
jgi:glycosyltransferase involved in cell wall biosynthesis